MPKVTLKTDDVRFTFCEGDGAFSLSAPPFELKNGRPSLKLGGKAVPLENWRTVKHAAGSLQAECTIPEGRLRLTVRLSDAEGVILHLTASLKKTCDDIALYYFDNARIPCEHLLSQGMKMGGCRSVLLENEAATPEFTGYYQLILTSHGTSLRLSYPLQHDFLASFAGQAEKGRISRFRAGTEVRQYSGRKIELPALTLRIGDGFRLLESYAEENGGPEKDFRKFVSPGWNSWDYYRWTVTEDDVLENAEFIARDPVLSKHVRRIIVDDGWQYAYGEWEANSLFPHGMKYLAGRIRKLGLEPGLWVAPIVIDLHSRIAQLHPEMLTRSVGGLPAPSWAIMNRRVFLLDPTVESSQQFIREMFTRFLSWGYRYFKLDFLGSLTSARRFADRSVPPGKLMELSIGTARQAVGSKGILLGCNYLFNGGPALADLVRVGSDIHAGWKNIKSNAVSVAARCWANKKLWVNDPDFALCRSMDTADDPDMQKLLACTVFIDPDDPATDHPFARFVPVNDDVRRPQMEVLLSIVLMNGGAVTLSDRMTRLNESGLDLARRTVAAESGETAIPLDLFCSDVPSYWFQRLKRGYRALLINWEDTPQERVFDLAELGLKNVRAVNFWNDRSVRVKNGRIEQVLAPHTCLLAEIR